MLERAARSWMPLLLLFLLLLLLIPLHMCVFTNLSSKVLADSKRLNHRVVCLRFVGPSRPATLPIFLSLLLFSSCTRSLFYYSSIIYALVTSDWILTAVNRGRHLLFQSSSVSFRIIDESIKREQELGEREASGFGVLNFDRVLCSLATSYDVRRCFLCLRNLTGTLIAS